MVFTVRVIEYGTNLFPNADNSMVWLGISESIQTVKTSVIKIDFLFFFWKHVILCTRKHKRHPFFKILRNKEESIPENGIHFFLKSKIKQVQTSITLYANRAITISLHKAHNPSTKCS